jgi:tetratricopeptide (TPR) repeat protein
MTIDTRRAAIDEAIARGDIALASRLAEAAVADGTGDPLLLQLAALHRETIGDPAGAHRHLAAALRRLPGEPAILVAIAGVWRRAGEPERALEILDAMVARGLDHAPTWQERGHALMAVNSYARAGESYRRAVARDPRLAASHAGIADTALRLGDRKAAATHGHSALALDPANLVALNALSALDIEGGRPIAARDRLTHAIAAAPADDPGLIESLTLLGDAHDALDEAYPAFEAYTRAQALYRTVNAARLGDERRGQTALIAHVRAQMETCDPAGWPPLDRAISGGGARAHVFLMGYPRSGTTLVENVLATADDVVALEEKPTLSATEAPFLGAPDGLAHLGTLDSATANRYRDAYWQAVATYGADVAGRVFVDMNPIRGISLPIIARLFPDARIVVTRRDPRDVVWSCFRRHFAPTPTGYALGGLVSAARHYAALMDLMETCFDRLRLEAHVLRYDDLVEDFDDTTRRLCAFVGIGWTPSLRNFGHTAGRRGVTTASVRQVRRGLFDGRGQWRRYERRLAPILPILQPWIERFGYA